MTKIKVCIVGFGQIGQMLFKKMCQSEDLEVTAVVDNDFKFRPQSIAGLFPNEDFPDLEVKMDVFALDDEEIDLFIVSAGSHLAEMTPLLLDVLKKKKSIITTCEELFFAEKTQPELWKKLDVAAKEAGVALLGCGINPGFLMDYLPMALAGCCRDIKHVKIERVQDASCRRLQFQKKIGAGLSESDFEAKKLDGSLKHVGLAESMTFIGKMLGWEFDLIEDKISMIKSEAELKLENCIEVQAHQARGVKQLGLASYKGVELVRMEFIAALGEPESYDRITLDGTPKIVSTINGGVNGDAGTVAVMMNLARAIIFIRKNGLLTMADMPVFPGNGNK